MMFNGLLDLFQNTSSTFLYLFFQYLFENMFLIFKIFDRFVNIAKNFNPDDAKNVRKRVNISNFL